MDDPSTSHTDVYIETAGIKALKEKDHGPKWKVQDQDKSTKRPDWKGDIHERTPKKPIECFRHFMDEFEKFIGMVFKIAKTQNVLGLRDPH